MKLTESVKFTYTVPIMEEDIISLPLLKIDADDVAEFGVYENGSRDPVWSGEDPTLVKARFDMAILKVVAPRFNKLLDVLRDTGSLLINDTSLKHGTRNMSEALATMQAEVDACTLALDNAGVLDKFCNVALRGIDAFKLSVPDDAILTDTDLSESTALGGVIVKVARTLNSVRTAIADIEATIGVTGGSAQGSGISQRLEILENLVNSETGLIARASADEDGNNFVNCYVKQDGDYADSGLRVGYATTAGSASSAMTATRATSDALGNNIERTYAKAEHNHDSAYAPLSHAHAGYATVSHNHDNVYAKRADIPVFSYDNGMLTIEI